MTNDGSCPNLNAMHGHDVHVVALDGDKLKPRTDQRKGGNGFGVNEDGAGYTLTAVDRHGVAYKAVSGGGKEVAPTLFAGMSHQFGTRKEFVDAAVVQCYENHAQDSRVKPIEVSDTRNQKDGSGGNNLPLVVHTTTPFVKTAHACGKDGLGEKWKQCEVAGTHNAIEGGDGRNQECIVHTAMAQNTRDGYNQTLTGDCVPTISGAASDLHHDHGVVSTNSNGIEFFTPGLTPECSSTLKHGTGDHRAAVLVSSKAKEGAGGE